MFKSQLAYILMINIIQFLTEASKLFIENISQYILSNKNYWSIQWYKLRHKFLKRGFKTLNLSNRDAFLTNGFSKSAKSAKTHKPPKPAKLTFFRKQIPIVWRPLTQTFRIKNSISTLYLILTYLFFYTPCQLLYSAGLTSFLTCFITVFTA